MIGGGDTSVCKSPEIATERMARSENRVQYGGTYSSGVVTADEMECKRKTAWTKSGKQGISLSLVRKRASGSVIEEKRDRHHLERYCHLGHRYNRPYHHPGDDRETDSNQMQV